MFALRFTLAGELPKITIQTLAGFVAEVCIVPDTNGGQIKAERGLRRLLKRGARGPGMQRALRAKRSSFRPRRRRRWTVDILCAHWAQASEAACGSEEEAEGG